MKGRGLNLFLSPDFVQRVFPSLCFAESAAIFLLLTVIYNPCDPNSIFAVKT